MDLALKDKAVIITGGSRGIGAATVRAFAEEGAKVAYCARGAKSINALQSSLADLGTQVRGYQCDVGDRDAYAAWLDTAVSDLGGVDCFVGNATGGVFQGDEGWRASFDIDLLSAVRGAEQLIPYMASKHAGSIVLLASINATDNVGAPMAYSAMKAALINYGNQLGAAAGQHGIRVNCVSPGPIHVDDGFWGEVSRSNPEQYTQVAGRHASGRLGTPEEVAHAICFLASERASWISRVNLVVDGGFSQRIQF